MFKKINEKLDKILERLDIIEQKIDAKVEEKKEEKKFYSANEVARIVNISQPSLSGKIRKNKRKYIQNRWIARKSETSYYMLTDKGLKHFKKIYGERN